MSQWAKMCDHLPVSNRNAKRIKRLFTQHQNITATKKFLASTVSVENSLRWIRKQETRTEDREPYLVFMRNPREAIWSQTSNASSADFIVKSLHTDAFSHHMVSSVETKACVTARHAVKTHPHVSVIWKSEVENRVQSVVGSTHNWFYPIPYFRFPQKFVMKFPTNSFRTSRRLHYQLAHCRSIQLSSSFTTSQKIWNRSRLYPVSHGLATF